MANWIALNSLAKGQFTSTTGAVQTGRSVNIYLRGTTTMPTVAPNPDGTGTPLTQPLTTNSNGDVPGYVQAEQAIDFFDVANSTRQQGEAVSALDVGASKPTLGTHAARPAAAPANNGLMYYETDTGLTFISDGTTWQLIKAGEELGYAEITTPYTSAASGATDVTGLSVTVTVGVRPIDILMDLGYVQISAGTAVVCQAIIAEGATSLASAWTVITSGQVVNLSRRRRIAPTPGLHTYKIQLGSASGVMSLNPSLSGPHFIQVLEV